MFTPNVDTKIRLTKSIPDVGQLVTFSLPALMQLSSQIQWPILLLYVID